MRKITSLMAVLLLSGSVFAQTNWTIDQAHSRIGFSVAHMGVSETDGKFNEFEGSVSSKSADFNGADVEFSAKVGSIDTDNEKRDGHLKSPDFFDAEKYPEIKFKGTLVKEGTKYKLKGKLTMKGVTKDASFDVTYGGTIDTGRGVKAGFKLNGVINRQDYGLTWSSKLTSGELIVGDEVTITAKIELDKKA